MNEEREVLTRAQIHTQPFFRNFPRDLQDRINQIRTAEELAARDAHPMQHHAVEATELPGHNNVWAKIARIPNKICSFFFPNPNRQATHSSQSINNPFRP